MLTAESLCHLTADEPGIGGAIKQRPEDFVVEELPLSDPQGHGDHLYLFIEKRKRLTTDVVRFLSRHFGVPWTAIGYAGLKDKHAVTRQWFSVEHATEARAAEFRDEFIQILDIGRNPRKLKRGYLRGNRFEIKVRGIDAGGAVRAKRVLGRLAQGGAPNFHGEQRFGYKRVNHLLGRALILGDLRGFLDGLLGGPEPSEVEPNRMAREAYEAGDYKRALELWPKVHRFERQAIGPLSRGAPIEHAVRAIDKPHLLLMISAYQSAIFNAVLNERIKAGSFATLLEGDLAFIHSTRGIFEVKEPAVEQPRCDRLEISPTGPMWGRKMSRACRDVGAAELRALHETGVKEEDFEHGRFTPDGARRVMRMLVREPLVSAGADEFGPYIYCGFELDRGSFATIVMREIMKNGPAADEADVAA